MVLRNEKRQLILEEDIEMDEQTSPTDVWTSRIQTYGPPLMISISDQH